MMPGRMLVATLTMLAMAVATAAEAAAAPPQPNATTLGFIDAAIAEGRLKAAADLARRARARGEESPELRLRDAEMLFADSQLRDAGAAFETLELYPELAGRARTGRALVAWRLGHADEADRLLKSALEADPGLARAWSARGVLADERRDWATAEMAYGQALALEPRNAAILNNRGYSRLLQKRPAEAEADLARAVAIDPGLEAAQTNLRFARGVQGRYVEAFDGSNPKQLARDLNTVGFAAMSRGDLAVAESYFARAIELNGRFDSTAAANLEYLKTLGVTKAPR